MKANTKKVEVYLSFLTIILGIEIINFLLSKQGVLKLYIYAHQLPWALPLHTLLPLWTIIYLLIAIAGARIWLKKKSTIRTFALSSWFIQMAFNIILPASFYYLPFPILPPILLSILMIALFVLLFYAFLLDKIATLCLLPYLIMGIYKLLFHWMLYILNIKLQ